MKQQSRVVLYGAGGHGKVVADALQHQGEFSIAGFLDDSVTGEVFGHPILGGKSVVASLVAQGITGAVVCLGDCTARAKVQAFFEAATISMITVIHPSASVARGAVIGAGSMILAQAVVGPDATLGKGCILNHGATVDHDCVLGDFVHVAPGANIAGGVRIGSGTHIGIGSSIKEGVMIGERCVIGAGSAVVENVPDKALYYGVPAKLVRML